MHIALCGPCSPAYLADLLHEDDAARVRTHPGLGGRPVADLARGLRTAGHDVTIVTMPATPVDEAEVFRGDGLRVLSVPSRHSRLSRLDGYRTEARIMARALREGTAADLVHAHWTYEFEWAAQLSRLPHVTTAHDCPTSIFRQMPDRTRLRRLLQAIRLKADIAHLSAVSPYTADAWHRQMRYPRPIEAIPNSIPDDISNITRRPARTPTILDIGDSSPRKNMKGLLQAFEIVRATTPSAVLRLVGPGLGPTDRMARWADDVGLKNGVTFVGVLDRSEIARELSQAWVLAHASLEEACPMAVLEALGSGLPVVGGLRSGGVPYVLDHGRNGRLSDVRSPQAFANDILASLFEGKVTSAAAGPLTRFHPAVVAAQYLDWYDKVLTGSST